jgi:hypothetical protein
MTNAIAILLLLALAEPPTQVNVVGEGTISTTLDEYGATFSRDGKTCFFTIKSPSTISNNVIVICESHFEKGKWSEPKIASFSGQYKDFSPSISPDGNKLFFASTRPLNGKPGVDLWMSERNGNNWNEPVNLGEAVNSPQSWEFSGSVSSDGTLFFCSSGTTGNFDIYYSKYVDRKFETPIRLDDNVNSDASDTDPYIAPDGSYLLFKSTGRADAMSEPGGGYPRGDLYVSFYKDGKWTPAKNLGPEVNSIAEESSPFVLNDQLYFASERNFIKHPMNPKLDYKTLQNGLNGLYNGLGNIYKVPVSVLNDLK